MADQNPQKIIIDTDPGIDDAMAIHQAFADPRLNVLGLTTIFGNVATPMATRNALRLAEMASYPAAVASGAAAPLVREPAPPADFVHGAEGFGTVPPAEPEGRADGRSAAVFMAETAAASPGEVIICAVGPLTNLALALDHDPGFARNVKSVVVMGGSIAWHGNVSACAEANIWGDPDAADAVFAADWDITMVGLDVTEKSRCTPEDFAAIAAASPAIGGFLNEAVDFYFDFHLPKTTTRCCFMHDPSAIFAITDPEFFDFEEMPLEVVRSGDEMGRTRAFEGSGRRNVKAAMRVRPVVVREKFVAILAEADTMAASRKGEL
ncbi:MAG: nucleoside hydrolase [Candidatus Puniceispirillales bacterium]